MNSNVPEWMLQEEVYEPKKDQDGFIIKSLLSVLGVLSKMRAQGAMESRGASTPIKIIYTFLFVILTACARNMFFVWCMLAGVLVRLCLLPGEQLKSVAKTTFGATIFAGILLLPAVFLGSPRTLLTVTSKVLVSVSLVSLLNHTTKWNELTGALRAFHVPDLFILTFDLTLKYIVMLGTICVDMLQALKMRSIGKNTRKGRSLSGVLGVTFLKSKEMSEEMYGAMCCRGFEGEYRILKKRTWKKTDLGYVVLIMAVIALFIYLERAM